MKIKIRLIYDLLPGLSFISSFITALLQANLFYSGKSSFKTENTSEIKQNVKESFTPYDY